MNIRLQTTAGLGILDFDYDDDWYPTTDGDGKSLAIINALSPATTWGEQTSWRPSGQLGGSPGAVDVVTSGTVFASVFRDNNTDGIRSPSEFGASQASVTIFSAGPNGQIGGGDDVQIGTCDEQRLGTGQLQRPCSWQLLLAVCTRRWAPFLLVRTREQTTISTATSIRSPAGPAYSASPWRRSKIRLRRA